MNDIIFNEPLKYSDVCEMFNEEKVNGGKSRKLQLDKWQKEYEIEKNGRNYIIIREYTDKEKYLLKNDKKFTINIERILLNKIKVSGNTQITLTYKEIFEGLNVVNKDYYKAKYKEFYSYLNHILIDHKKELKYYEFLPDAEYKRETIEKDMRNYFFKTNNILKKMVKDALESMQKRDLIIWSRSFKLIRKHKNYVETHCTTLEEDSIILDIIDEAKREINDKGLFFMNKEEKEKYYKIIDELIFEKLGYDHCHDAVRLVMSEKAIERDLNKIEEVGMSKRILNKGTFNKLNNSKELESLMPKPHFQVFNEEFIKNH